MGSCSWSGAGGAGGGRSKGNDTALSQGTKTVITSGSSGVSSGRVIGGPVPFGEGNLKGSHGTGGDPCQAQEPFPFSHHHLQACEMFNTKNDVELTPGPGDGTSCLSFSPVADYLSASCWDGQVSAV